MRGMDKKQMGASACRNLSGSLSRLKHLYKKGHIGFTLKRSYWLLHQKGYIGFIPTRSYWLLHQKDHIGCYAKKVTLAVIVK